LVFWFLLCGTFNNLHKLYMFNINSYTKEYLVFLQNIILNNCNIKTHIKEHTTVKKTYYYLCISKESNDKF
jgi:hypothetical protein